MATIRYIAVTLLSAVGLLAGLDVIFLQTFPQRSRLCDNFSLAYLQREINELRNDKQTIVLGDSALWGYGVRADQAAVYLLQNRGRRWTNLAYEGGSPANTFAMLRLLVNGGVKPRAVVFNVNLKEFNAADSAYAKLYPAVERMAWHGLASGDRAKLQPGPPETIEVRLDRMVASIWRLYAMRSDVRESLFGAPDAATALQGAVEAVSGTKDRKAAAHSPTAAKFEGTYDLSPLDTKNVSVYFLQRIGEIVRLNRFQTYALLTPTNHRLLRDYIDSPEYKQQLSYVTRILHGAGIRVIDYDRAFSASEFIDNDHLTAAGNARFAQLLARDVHA